MLSSECRKNINKKKLSSEQAKITITELFEEIKKLRKKYNKLKKEFEMYRVNSPW